MQNSVVHKAKELKPKTRAAIEEDFGRTLGDEDEISIISYLPHDELKGEAREKGAAKLHAYFAEADARGTEPEQEVEGAIEEAMRSVRPGYRERK